MIESEIIGNDPTGMDSDVLAGEMIYRYGMAHPGTFGGMWLDRQANGTTVIAFTDDPEAHRAAIAQLRPTVEDLAMFAGSPPPEIDLASAIGERDAPFDVVQVTYSLDELLEMTEAVSDVLSVPTSGDVIRNGVMVHPLRPPTIEKVVAMAELVEAVAPIEAVCIDAEAIGEAPTAPPTDAPLDLIAMPAAGGRHPPDTEVECGGARFTLADYWSMIPIEEFDPGLQLVVDDLIAGPIIPDWPADGWTVLTADDDSATIVRITDAGLLAIVAAPGRGGWIWEPGAGGGPCQTLQRALPAGLGEVDWTVEQASPTDTTVEVVVAGRACASGEGLGDRLVGPQVVETAGAVLVAFAEVLPEGEQTCPDSPGTPVTLALGEPLGDRATLDGRTVGDVRELLADADSTSTPGS